MRMQISGEQRIIITADGGGWLMTDDSFERLYDSVVELQLTV